MTFRLTLFMFLCLTVYAISKSNRKKNTNKRYKSNHKEPKEFKNDFPYEMDRLQHKKILAIDRSRPKPQKVKPSAYSRAVVNKQKYLRNSVETVSVQNQMHQPNIGILFGNLFQKNIQKLSRRSSNEYYNKPLLRRYYASQPRVHSRPDWYTVYQKRWDAAHDARMYGKANISPSNQISKNFSETFGVEYFSKFAKNNQQAISKPASYYGKSTVGAISPQMHPSVYTAENGMSSNPISDKQAINQVYLSTPIERIAPVGNSTEFSDNKNASTVNEGTKQITGSSMTRPLFSIGTPKQPEENTVRPSISVSSPSQSKGASTVYLGDPKEPAGRRNTANAGYGKSTFREAFQKKKADNQSVNKTTNLLSQLWSAKQYHLNRGNPKRKKHYGTFLNSFFKHVNHITHDKTFWNGAKNVTADRRNNLMTKYQNYIKCKAIKGAMCKTYKTMNGSRKDILFGVDEEAISDEIDEDDRTYGNPGYAVMGIPSERHDASSSNQFSSFTPFRQFHGKNLRIGTDENSRSVNAYPSPIIDMPKSENARFKDEIMVGKVVPIQDEHNSDEEHSENHSVMHENTENEEHPDTDHHSDYHTENHGPPKAHDGEILVGRLVPISAPVRVHGSASPYNDPSHYDFADHSHVTNSHVHHPSETPEKVYIDSHRGENAGTDPNQLLPFMPVRKENGHLGPIDMGHSEIISNYHTESHIGELNSSPIGHMMPLHSPDTHNTYHSNTENYHPFSHSGELNNDHPISHLGELSNDHPFSHSGELGNDHPFSHSGELNNDHSISHSGELDNQHITSPEPPGIHIHTDSVHTYYDDVGENAHPYRYPCTHNGPHSFELWHSPCKTPCEYPGTDSCHCNCNDDYNHGDDHTFPHSDDHAFSHGDDHAFTHYNHGNDQSFPHGNDNAFPHDNHGNDQTFPHGDDHAFPYGNDHAFAHNEDGNNFEFNNHDERAPLQNHNFDHPYDNAEHNLAAPYNHPVEYQFQPYHHQSDLHEIIVAGPPEKEEKAEEAEEAAEQAEPVEETQPTSSCGDYQQESSETTKGSSSNTASNGNDPYTSISPEHIYPSNLHGPHHGKDDHKESSSSSTSPAKVDYKNDPYADLKRDRCSQKPRNMSVNKTNDNLNKTLDNIKTLFQNMTMEPESYDSVIKKAKANLTSEKNSSLFNGTKGDAKHVISQIADFEKNSSTSNDTKGNAKDLIQQLEGSNLDKETIEDVENILSEKNKPEKSSKISNETNVDSKNVLSQVNGHEKNSSNGSIGNVSQFEQNSEKNSSLQHSMEDDNNVMNKTTYESVISSEQKNIVGKPEGEQNTESDHKENRIDIVGSNIMENVHKFLMKIEDDKYVPTKEDNIRMPPSLSIDANTNGDEKEDVVDTLSDNLNTVDTLKYANGTTINNDVNPQNSTSLTSYTTNATLQPISDTSAVVKNSTNSNVNNTNIESNAGNGNSNDTSNQEENQSDHHRNVTDLLMHFAAIKKKLVQLIAEKDSSLSNHNKASKKTEGKSEEAYMSIGLGDISRVYSDGRGSLEETRTAGEEPVLNGRIANGDLVGEKKSAKSSEDAFKDIGVSTHEFVNGGGESDNGHEFSNGEGDLNNGGETERNGLIKDTTGTKRSTNTSKRKNIQKWHKRKHVKKKYKQTKYRNNSKKS